MQTDEEKKQAFRIEGKFVEGLSGFVVTLKIGHNIKLAELCTAFSEMRETLISRTAAAMRAKGYSGENMPPDSVTSAFTFGDLEAFEKSNSVATPQGMIMGKGGMA